MQLMQGRCGVRVTVWTSERQLGEGGFQSVFFKQETPEEDVTSTCRNQTRLWGRCGCCPSGAISVLWSRHLNQTGLV